MLLPTSFITNYLSIQHFSGPFPQAVVSKEADAKEVIDNARIAINPNIANFFFIVSPPFIYHGENISYLVKFVK